VGQKSSSESDFYLGHWILSDSREPYAFETELPLTRLDRRDQNRHVPSRRNFTGAPVHTASHGSHSLPAR
jgi:hypothetical protein